MVVKLKKKKARISKPKKVSIARNYLKYFTFAFLILFILISIAIGYYFYNYHSYGNGNIPIIEPLTKVFKIIPEDRGGIKVRHKERKIFNLLEGRDEDINKVVVSIDENLVDVDNSNRNYKYTMDNVKSGTFSTTDDYDSNPSNISNSKEEEIDPLSSIFLEIEENANKNNDDKATEEKTEIETEKQEQETATQDNTNDGIALVFKPKTNITKNYNNTKIEKSIANKTATKIDLSQRNQIKRNSLLNEQEQPKKELASNNGSYYVQISSHSSNNDAKNAWLNFTKQFPELAQNFQSKITKALVSGKEYHKLSYGGFSTKLDAQQSCDILKRKQRDCFVIIAK